MELIVTRRGGDVPDKDDVSPAGLPLITLPSVTKNAWLLWRRALTAAQQTGSRMAHHDGVPGWMWTGALVALEQQEWHNMISGRTSDPLQIAATRTRNALRRYLRESGNLVMQGPARGPSGSTWFIRDEFSDVVPPSWTDDTDSARSRRGEVKTSWKCPDCGEDQPGRISLNEHRATQHPVSAPELPGESFLRDILTCMGDEERMASADLLVLLSAGNPSVYGSMGGIILFGKRLKDAGVPFGQLWLGQGASGGVNRTGIKREDVVAALMVQEDAEAQAIMQEAHATALPAADPAARLSEAASAMLREYDLLKRVNEEQATELDKLRREPVSQEIIDAALEKIVGPLRAERDDLKRRLEAAKKVIGF